jgi:predicted transcriptional regulator
MILYIRGDTVAEVIASAVPIKWKLREYLEANEISPYALAKHVGLEPPNMYRMLRGDGPKMFDREVLGRIIRGLRELTNKPVSVADVLEEEA